MDRRAVFSGIYSESVWGSRVKSGPGSDPKSARPYIRIVERLLDDPKLSIRSIVDLGCGDWSMSSVIRWGNRIYTGIDVVPSVIDRIKSMYSADNITFRCADFLTDDLPAADIVLVKDVLQHLSNESVQRFIAVVAPKYPYALATNDSRRVVLSLRHRPRIRRGTGVVNGDIADGQSRPLRLRLPPFGVKPVSVWHYHNLFSDSQSYYFYTKEVLLLGRDSSPPARKSYGC